MTELTIAIADIGNYIESDDVGLHVFLITGGSVTGPVGKLRWGLAQFGTTGILGYAPTITPTMQRWNILQVE
jgi:hypothetical protein